MTPALSFTYFPVQSDWRSLISAVSALMWVWITFRKLKSPHRQRSVSWRGLWRVAVHGLVGAVHIQRKKEQQRKYIQGSGHLKIHKKFICGGGMKFSGKVLASYLCPYLFINSELFLASRQGWILRWLLLLLWLVYIMLDSIWLWNEFTWTLSQAVSAGIQDTLELVIFFGSQPQAGQWNVIKFCRKVKHKEATLSLTASHLKIRLNEFGDFLKGKIFEKALTPVEVLIFS